MKMDYEKFKEWAKDNIGYFLPEKFDGADVDFARMIRPGVAYDAMTVRSPETNAAPAINLEDMYGRYKNGASLYDVGQMMASIAQTETPKISAKMFSDYEAIKDKLFVRVNNIEKNAELLSHCPHIKVGDMAITYSIQLDQDGGSLMSTTINNDLLNSMGVDKDTLHRDAMANSQKIMPLEAKSMSELMGIHDENHPSSNVMVVTNDIKVDGAAAIFYPGEMEKMAERIGSYYMCPSSIHETILVPDHMGDNESLSQTVSSVNDSAVIPEERLSNTVYHYDAKEKVFEKASDYEKRIEGLTYNDRKYKIDLTEDNNDSQHERSEIHFEDHPMKMRM